MSDNKFIKRLKGEQTDKSVLEIKNESAKTSFANMPQGTSNAVDVYSDHRGNATGVLKGTENWKLDGQNLIETTTVYGDGRDFTDSFNVFGNGLWVNATCTFATARRFSPNTKFVLKLCGHDLETVVGNTVDFTLIVKFGTSNLISKTFTVTEQAFNFCKEFVIDFAESNSSTIKADAGSTMQIQLLCADAGAQAVIYNGMTVFTALQRRVDGDAVASDKKTFDEVVDDVEQIQEDLDDLEEYVDDTFVRLDGGSTMTGPLKMRATSSFQCAIAPFWDGVGFYKLNSDDSVTLIASIETPDGFVPWVTNTYNIGSSLKKWKNLYLAGKAFVSTINNGADITVPATSGTMALTSDLPSVMTGATAGDAGTSGLVPAPTAGDQGKFLHGDGTWATVDALPLQTGHSGEYLTTDGSSASWAAVNTLPSQTGQAGKFLTTDGTDASWSDKPLVNTATGTNSLTILGTTHSRSNSINIGVGSVIGASDNIAIGNNAKAYVGNNIAIGNAANVTGTGHKNSIALGFGASVNAKHSVQIGNGTNSDDNTFKFKNENGNFEIMSADGTMPEARLADTTSATAGQVLTLDSNLDAEWKTISTMTGADGINAGTSGLVPAPSATDNNNFLRGDGTWADIDYVVEKQDPNVGNNYTWYRKYKSGWVEQGGCATTNSGNPCAVTLPVEMANINYNINILGQTAADGYGNAQWQVMSISTASTPKSTTGFYGQPSITGYNLLFYWEVRGMAA